MNTQALWSSYHDQLHTNFTLEGEPFQGLVLEIVQVSDLQDSPQMASFSVLFHGPAANPLNQHIYRLKHPVLGSLDLFLVPVAGDASGFFYEAVFNHLIPSG